MINKTSKFEILSNQIEWDNWKHNKGTTKEKFWQISEVIYCRLDWLKEQIESRTIDKEEALDSIKIAQVFISGITDKQIKRSKTQ